MESVTLLLIKAFFYLPTMLKNKPKIILEYKKKTNDVLKRKDVDWTSSADVSCMITIVDTALNSSNST